LALTVFTRLPHYEIRDNKIYPAVTHPKGADGLPHYEIKG
jgi:hypothetical protein